MNPVNMKRNRRGSLMTRNRAPVSTEDLGLELRAALGASRELGPEKESEIVASFLERVEAVIDAQVNARLAEARPRQRDRLGRTVRLFIALAFAVPLTAVAQHYGPEGMIMTWVAIFLMTMLVQ